MESRWLAGAVLAGGLWVTAAEARAERAGCETILAALAAGRSATQVAEAEHTTHARVSACQRIAEHRERLAGQRGHVADAREARRAGRH